MVDLGEATMDNTWLINAATKSPDLGRGAKRTINLYDPGYFYNTW